MPDLHAVSNTASASPEQIMVCLEQVHKVYPNGAIALQGINLTISKGAFLLITGRSGSGKSTLLKLLYGAEQPTQVKYCGRASLQTCKAEPSTAQRKMA
jgi:cell division ATP-binding protein FtsE